MANSKLLDVTDGYGTRVTVLERVVSDWQKELRLTVSGRSLVKDTSRHGNATHHRSVTIKKPAELEDLAEKLRDFLCDTSAQAELRLALQPHNRLAGWLRRDEQGTFWDVDNHRGCRSVRVDPGVLIDLAELAESYA